MTRQNQVATIYEKIVRTDKKKLIKITAITLAAVALGICVVFAVYGIIYNVRRNAAPPVDISSYTGDGDDVIHFMNTGGSDAILIESNGKFALVDCAEDTDNPRGLESLELEGYEQVVVDYVKKVAADQNGKVTLEFVVGTHAHSDHLGGFDTLFNDPDVTVKDAYLKRYYEDRISDYEVTEWDNTEVYNQTVEAALANGINPIQDLDAVGTITLGDFAIDFLATEEADPDKKVGENDNSVALLLKKGENKILLMGDVNYGSGDENRIAKQVGKVDLMKVGHHGLGYSTGSPLLTATQPPVAIVTNLEKNIYFGTKFRLVMNSRSAIYSTGEYNGIAAVIGDDKGDITLLSNIH